jgi:hypothetical protein
MKRVFRLNPLVFGGLSLWGLWVCLFVCHCQDYDFEEVPSSVIKEKRWGKTVTVSQDVDILFVVDNSGSMVGEQTQLAASFENFTAVLDEKFGADKYRIAIITPGIPSNGCQACSSERTSSCINETGENGIFQDRRGKIVGEPVDIPSSWDFIADRECRVVTSQNLDCFYKSTDNENPNNEKRGTVMVGVTGCGYERGLSAIEQALQPNILAGENANFLRPEATLAVIVVTDEEDCGQVGDVTEGSLGGLICYFAAKGEDPIGEKSDDSGKPYRLKPVQDYYDFLMSKKNNKEGMVKFVAIVGVLDKDNPLETIIEYEEKLPAGSGKYDAKYVCETPNCTGPCGVARDTCIAGCDVSDTICNQGCTGTYNGCVKSCKALPGTRYVQLADMFGLGEDGNGMVDTICQENFSETMEKVGNFVACPREFKLPEAILDPALANIIVNQKLVPRYSCTNQDPKRVIECRGKDDATTCPDGSTCAETWTYCPVDTCPQQIPGVGVRCNPLCLDPIQCDPVCLSDPNAPGGKLAFAKHYDPCTLIDKGEVNIEVIYATN